MYLTIASTETDLWIISPSACQNRHCLSVRFCRKSGARPRSRRCWSRGRVLNARMEMLVPEGVRR